MEEAVHPRSPPSSSAHVCRPQSNPMASGRSSFVGSSSTWLSASTFFRLGPAGLSVKKPSSGSRLSPGFCVTTVIELAGRIGRRSTSPTGCAMMNACRSFPGPGDCDKGKCLCVFC